MKVTIDIPKEYENDFIGDKFKDFFSRVIADINCDGMCGKYEEEIAEMFLKTFDKAIVGEINPNANVIPVANITINKADLQRMVEDKVKDIEIDVQKLQEQTIDDFVKVLNDTIPYDICDGQEAIEYINDAVKSFKRGEMNGKMGNKKSTTEKRKILSDSKYIFWKTS